MNPVIKYALAALLLLGSSFSHAGEWWSYSNDSYSSKSAAISAAQSGYGVGALCGVETGTNPYNIYYDRSTSSSDECENAGQPYPYGWYFTIYQHFGTCPSQLPYEWSDGSCQAEEEVSCQAGADPRVVEYSPSEMADPDFNTNQAIISNGSCQYDSVGIAGCDAETGSCFYEYEQNGQQSVGSETQPTFFDGTPSMSESSNSDGGSTTYQKDDPTTNPDGSTTQTTTETTTNTTGSGTTVWNDGQYIYVRDSSGTVTQYQRTNTTTTQTDGSSTEVTTTSQTVSTPSSTTTTVNTSSGTATITSQQGTSDGSTTVTTDTYDSNGNLVSSETTKTGATETGDGDETKEGNCGAPNQPTCDVTISGEEHLSDPNITINQSKTSGLSLYDNTLADILAAQDDEGSFLEFIELDFFSGRTCDPAAFSSDYHGSTFQPLAGFCSFYDDDMRPILYWALYMIAVFALFRTYEQAVKGGH